MTNKNAIFAFLLIVSTSAYAFPDVGRIVFRVVTIDESSMLPLENTQVKAIFDDNPTHWGDETVERVERRLTDAKGMCKFAGTSNHGEASYIVEEVPGYYATSMVRYQAINEHSSIMPIPYRCEPYDSVYTTLLQRIEHPIPLYAREVNMRNKKTGIGGFDGTNAVLRFDFIADDWLPPDGNGKHADMIIRTDYRLRDTVKDGKYHVQVFYDFTSRIEFPGEGNGLVEKNNDGLNCGIKIRVAPETGYAPGTTLRFGRSRKKTEVKGVWPDVYTESDNNRCYSFRIRSRYDDSGNLVDAYYGKIYGDFKFNGNDKVGLNEVGFSFYLNPKSLDRNLEWDTTQNLCPNPGHLPFKLTNKSRLEP